MKISIKQTGGYAGMELSIAEIDTDKLRPDLAERVKALIAEIGFYSLPAELGTQIGADLLRYQVTVNDAGKQHTVSISDIDAAANEKFRKLIEQISALE